MSKILKFIILIFLAPNIPESVELFVVSHSQLKLTWQTPSRPNGIITGYRIRWKMDSNDRLQPVDGRLNETILLNGATSFVMNGLGKC